MIPDPRMYGTWQEWAAAFIRKSQRVSIEDPTISALRDSLSQVDTTVALNKTNLSVGTNTVILSKVGKAADFAKEVAHYEFHLGGVLTNASAVVAGTIAFAVQFSLDGSTWNFLMTLLATAPIGDTNARGFDFKSLLIFDSDAQSPPTTVIGCHSSLELGDVPITNPIIVRELGTTLTAGTYTDKTSDLYVRVLGTKTNGTAIVSFARLTRKGIV